MKEPKVWMNGRFVAASKAAVPLSDRAFLYGDGVFETMRAYAGIVFRLDAHLDRLFDSLKAIYIKPPFSKEYIKDRTRRTVIMNGLKSAYVRLTVTRGAGMSGIDIRPGSRPDAVIVARELEEYPRHVYERGISACVARSTRQNECSPVSRIKSLNYLNYIMARAEARKRGCGEAIIRNTAGNIAECSASNIFIVKNGRLITPSVDSGILSGVTRGAVIDIARRLRIKVIEKAVTREELTGCDEAFLTSSIAEIIPITMIDSKKVGSGRPGELTRLFRISYQKEVIREVLAH